ncbi:hypothetical protein CE91St64_33420 [Faecalicatena contorta]|nr:hypothetical protein CE91St64_33420 [Faecalicatena contorta]
MEYTEIAVQISSFIVLLHKRLLSVMIARDKDTWIRVPPGIPCKGQTAPRKYLSNIV